MNANIIGGADWPTAAFLLSRLTRSWLPAALIVLLTAAAYLILRRKKK